MNTILKKNFTVIRKCIYHTIFRVFCIVSDIDEEKYFFSSYNHTKYSGNPKFVSDYLLNNFEDRKIVWSFRSTRYIPEDIKQNIRISKLHSLRYIYEIATSKYVFSNQRTNFIVPKRPNQVYVQLWHSSAGLKSIERGAISSLSQDYIRLAMEDSEKTDIMISGSKFNSNRIRKDFWYDGKILEFGTPRNDIFFKKTTSYLRNRIGIDDEAIALLYAPTFRAMYNYDYENIDLNALQRSLQTYYEKEVIVLYRFHPSVQEQHSFNSNSEKVKNISDYDEMQDLLAAVDILVTDYSSSMFDFMLSSRKTVLFVPDWKMYSRYERDLNFKLDELPFPAAFDNEELIEKICDFDWEQYKTKLKDFSDKIGSFEQGTATENLVNYLDYTYKRGAKN